MAVNRNRTGRSFDRATGRCVRCGRDRELRARGLDPACYMAAKRDGTLDDYPRRNTTRATFLEDYDFLRSAGESRAGALARLGKSDAALRSAQYAARKRDAAGS